MSLQSNRVKVWMFSRLMKFSGWLQQLPNKLTPPPFRLVQIGSGFWHSRALYVVARLDVATVLADASMSIDEISLRVAARTDAIYRLLRMLSAIGVFRETAPRIFSNNTLSSYLRSDNPKNVRAMILMHNSDEMSRPWFKFLEAAVNNGGVPFRLAHGQELYDYMDRHPDFDALFSEAMDSVEALTGDSFATDFDWTRFDRVIDVGGSKGGKAVAILKRHPHLKAVVFDRAHVIFHAREFWADREAPALLARLAFEAGDVLQSVPRAHGDNDIYFLSAVLHGFDDDTCVRILCNLAAAIAGTAARVALMEVIMPDVRADAASASFDMQMFIGTSGRERTRGQWHSLFQHTGLELEEEIALQSFARILVLRSME